MAISAVADVCGAEKKRWVPVTIEVSDDIEPIKDLRNSTSAPDLGYAGAMLETSTLVAEWFYISNRVESAKLVRDAGAWVVRPWSANDCWQRGLAWVATKDRAALQKKYPHAMFIDPHAYFSFWKENGMKAILCLENYSVFTDVETGARTGDIETVTKVICDYVRWIVDNGYKDCVAGFECGNEAYWGNEPEKYGERWSAIIPEMKRIWPEMKIGIPLAPCARLRLFASHRKRQAARMVGDEPRHECTCRIACEVFARIPDAGRGIPHPCARRVEVKSASIIRHVRVSEVETQLHRAREAGTARPVADAVGIAFYEQRVVRDLDALAARQSEDVCPKPAVADRQRLLLPADN